MMVIVVSLFTGFIDNIEKAAKGLFGDVIMSTGGQRGLAHYDEFIEEVDAKVPEVEAAAPYILSYGMLRLSGFDHYRNPVQVAGIRFPDHAKVSDFERGLFVQGPENLTWDPPVDKLIARVEAEHQRTIGLKEEMEAREFEGEHRPPELANEIDRIQSALDFHRKALSNLRNIDRNRAALAHWQARFEDAIAEGVGPEELESARQALAQAQADKAPAETIAKLRSDLAATEKLVYEYEESQANVEKFERRAYETPDSRIVLGLGIDSLSFRTDIGDVVRLWTPGQKVVLYVFPLGKGGVSMSALAPESGNFSVIDDNRSGVPPIDSAFVYVPFETLQKMNHMDAEKTADGTVPPRCSQIIFKVTSDDPTEEQLRDIGKKIKRVWLDFKTRYPEASKAPVDVETWRQRQHELLSTVESQRVIMIIVLGVISIVALILIFVILYVIVVQKTADIGVLKAIGASSVGVARVFLLYGAALGTVGAALGMLFGYLFVRNTNSIADWLAVEFGFTPFRYGFLFDRFPDEVQFHTAAYIVVAAIFSGLVGALLPALKAARMQPVEALRYE